MRHRSTEIAAAVGGAHHGPEVVVTGVEIDSRTVGPGALFVPIRAERDGHDFIGDAHRAGAIAHLSERGPGPGTTIVVADASAALTAIGSSARDRLGGPVIGITGSVGKTSTKDMLAAVLAFGRTVTASPRSFNNELGVPLTLANAADDTEVTVVEMGARGVGHIRGLCQVARPTVGIVTRVVAAHTSEFADEDEIAVAKGELIEALPPDGLAVLNADDGRVAAMASRSVAPVTTFGHRGEVRAETLTVDDDLRARFDLVTPEATVGVHLGAAGAHQVVNALASAAAALGIGVPLGDVAAGLEGAALSPWRMQLLRHPSGARIINDAYNANPTSVHAALEALAGLPAERRVAVLGVMAELGPASRDEHRRMGRLAADLDIDVIAVDADYGPVRRASGIDEARELLGPLDDGHAVLVKGSRVAGLEALVDRLVHDSDTGEP